MTDDRWYFAYGSNLLTDQMVKRTGPIRQAFRCRLKGFRFAFNQQSDDGQIYANIVHDLTSEVRGVVYLFDPMAFEKMDHYEGVADDHYERIPSPSRMSLG